MEANAILEVEKQIRPSVEQISRDKLVHGERVLQLDTFSVGQWDFMTRTVAG